MHIAVQREHNEPTLGLSFTGTMKGWVHVMNFIFLFTLEALDDNLLQRDRKCFFDVLQS